MPLCSSAVLLAKGKTAPQTHSAHEQTNDGEEVTVYPAQKVSALLPFFSVHLGKLDCTVAVPSSFKSEQRHGVEDGEFNPNVYDRRAWLVAVQSVSDVRLCDPMDCGPPGSSVHGVPQARVLE